MQPRILSLMVILSLTLLACTKSNQCDSNQANNKLLALGSIQARLVSKGGDSGMKVSLAIAQESAPVAELIAQGKYNEACQKADEIAGRLGIDLAQEQKGMITIEQLAKDGGKGSGTCSIEDAAKKQMQIHSQLQAEVNAGRRDTDVFREFNEDTKSFGELLSTNPSKACELLDSVKTKYNLP